MGIYEQKNLDSITDCSILEKIEETFLVIFMENEIKTSAEIQEATENTPGAGKNASVKKSLVPIVAAAAGVAVLGIGGVVTHSILTAMPDPLKPLMGEGLIDESETDKLGDLIYRCYEGYLDKEINIGDFPVIGEILMHAKTKGYQVPVTVLDELVAAGAKPTMPVQVGMAERSVWDLAIDLGDLEVIKALVRLGTQPENKSVTQAVESSNEQLLRTFAEVGMNLNYRKNNAANTPLMAAVIAGNESMVRLLIELKADINLRKKVDGGFVSCVDIADAMGNENLLNLLLQSGAIPTGRVAERMVYDACESNSMETLSTLIEIGVDVMSFVNKTPEGREHLCAVAIQNDNAEMLRFFLLMGVSPNAKADISDSLLHLATRLGKKSCVQMLLDGGAEPELENSNGYDSITMSRGLKHEEIEKMLLSALNPIERIGYNKELNRNVKDKKAATDLVVKGLDIYEGKMKPTEYNLVVGTICVFADSNVALPYEEIAEMLRLEGQKDGVLNVGTQQYTLSGWAASVGDVQLLDVLKQAGVDMNAPGNKEGQSLFAIAMTKKQPGVLKKLVEWGCDTNAADGMGKTPLCYATDAETIKTLLDSGANINATSGDKKQSALMSASASNNANLVQLLLEAGANPKLTDTDGQTASALAQSAGFASLASALQAAEESTDNPAESFKKALGGVASASDSTGQNANTGVTELLQLIERLSQTSYSNATQKLYQKRLLGILPRIAAGESVNTVIKNANGTTALHNACGLGHYEIVKWLVENGADCNARTAKGASVATCIGNDPGGRIAALIKEKSSGAAAARR